MKISSITCYQILDSRGNPTLEGHVSFDDGRQVTASVPSGASVGKHEVINRFDGGNAYDGKGVSGVAKDVQGAAQELLFSENIDFGAVDAVLQSEQRCWNKKTLGGNGALLISLLAAKIQAVRENKELFQLYAQKTDHKIDSKTCLLLRANMIGGGRHAANKMAFQEFMIQSNKACDPVWQQESITKIYHLLAAELDAQGLGSAVGDEGAYAPTFSQTGFLAQEKRALELLCEAVEKAGFGGQFNICIDVASSEFFDGKKQLYLLDDQQISSKELVGVYGELINQYPIVSIEDGMDEDDWAGWKLLTDTCGSAVELVGDDLFVTQISRVRKGIDDSVANAVLIKPNQVGAISEALQVISHAQSNGYSVVASHRSGETDDASIIDLAIGAGANACKVGAPARGERIAKYNRFQEIYRTLKK